jgi:hypothetical protein
MFFTDGRKIEFVLGVVRVDEIMSDLVRQTKIPVNKLSSHKQRGDFSMYHDVYALEKFPLRTSASSG